jgi:hypothetical protein
VPAKTRSVSNRIIPAQRCPGRDSNPYGPFGPEGFKPSASAISPPGLRMEPEAYAARGARRSLNSVGSTEESCDRSEEPETRNSVGSTEESCDRSEEPATRNSVGSTEESCDRSEEPETRNSSTDCKRAARNTSLRSEEGLTTITPSTTSSATVSALRPSLTTPTIGAPSDQRTHRWGPRPGGGERNPGTTT